MNIGKKKSNKGIVNGEHWSFRGTFAEIGAKSEHLVRVATKVREFVERAKSVRNLMYMD